MILSFFDPITYNGAPTADIFRSYQKYFDEVAASFIIPKFFISGSPRPELLSYQIYGDVRYYWVLLMINGIYDPFHGWIKSEEAVHGSAAQKYVNMPNGANEILYHVNSEGQKFWRMSEYPIGSGNWYDLGDDQHRHLQYRGTLVPVTGIEHELNVNESKRTINIVSPSDMTRFLDLLTRRLEKVRDGS